MAAVDTNNLRNVALLSHSGAGKTTLCEALLFTTNIINRMGRIEDGNTVSDYEQEEIKREGSTQTSLIHCSLDGTKANVLDTPGYDDFMGEVASALRVVEGMVIVVAAPSGVEVGTERAWEMSQKHQLPRLIFVNKMDRENADFRRTLDSLESTFGRKCVPFQIPVGSEDNFEGVIDLLEVPNDVPSGLEHEVEEARDRLMEAVAETDDDLATKYLEGEEISQEDMLNTLKKAVRVEELVPVLFGSSTKCIGVKELLEAIVRYLPSPDEANDPETMEVPMAALVFKTTADQFVGKLSLFRVYRGTFQSNSEAWNSNKGQAIRLGQLYVPEGKNSESVDAVGPGDIGAVAKLSDTETNDTLCQKDAPISLSPINFPQGNYTMAVYPTTKADLEKMSTSLSKIVEEDPSLSLTREPDTGESLLKGLGDSHLDVSIGKIKRKFGADIKLRLPLVPYKETIASRAQAEYKHKKQSGGHGQYGHVLLHLEPLEKGSGFEFDQEISGGAVPREYIPWVEKGVVKGLAEGVMVGYPVVDVKVVLYDGTYHDVDSSGMSFEIAGSHAIKLAVAQANPTLLEPIMKLTIRVPDSFNGEVMGDVNSKRGRILGMNPEGGYTTIETEVPQAEILRYSTELRSLTQGRGSFNAELARYEAVPFNIAEKTAVEAKRAKEAAAEA